LVVVPSILKVAVPYAVPFFLLVSILGVQYRGGLLLDKLFPNGVTTQSVGELAGLAASVAFLSFVSLYLLIVAVHLLGLIYVTRKDELGWLRK
jgi:ABC-type microcin C transport system permease subunit YejB